MAEVHDQKGKPSEEVPKPGMQPKKDAKINGVGQPSAPQAASNPGQYPLPQGCPPTEAIDGPIHLFRMSEAKKPAASDCLTAYEQGRYINHDPCRRRSLSGYTDRNDAERLRRTVRHFNDHQICEGTVPAGAGLHLSTPSVGGKSHWSWWPSQGIVRHRFFSVTS